MQILSKCFFYILFNLCKFVLTFSEKSYKPSGLLNVYKPYGVSSTYVCNKIKNIINENFPKNKGFKIPVGHGGTLDRYTEGVLAVGIGDGTKILESYLKGDKEYICTGTFGFETDTNDILGKIIHTSNWEYITDEMLEKAIRSLKGFQVQESPTYSAKKHKGIPMYEYALNNIQVPSKSSLVHIKDIYRIKNEELPNFSLFVHCSGGTYIRSVVRDIGRRLNSRATMASLIRTKKLNFHIKDSLKLEDLTYETILNNIKTPRDMNMVFK
ncbi:tRNA pseudouridine(55) synthase [Theileria parva strain Muguga]|uniref:tRNA pseudouridine(55) synthase n=1 Tax=Theileria parva strain Muguga TaxID=333668 RepID=UPI001C6222E5|nr:tRNA pseudouridine(55) synthase [Theileria parva strain Muguga]EAN32663.2 tRNA pseudouridine(55) synthase [Theileria parva strain Muguga]